ncbi:MAG: rRNA (uracil1498-N3)-methyltransferase [Frankiales bacterium]|nr:rRNA (uracil1498-N3)-methyltransferase [Frankiales bacterium]
MTNPVFLCPDLSRDTVLLDGPEGRHAALVRRMRVGEPIDLVDGQGTRATGAVVATTKDTVTVDVSARSLEPAPAPRLTVVQALAKGDRGELAVELMTEVGVDVVVPWEAARCIAKWTDKSLQRWRSTAQEAAKQSRRAWFPEVREVASTADVVGLPGQLVVLHEEASAPLSTVELTGDVVLVVGPEGGIGADELAALGGTAVRLGDTVLRTSTAGAAAAAVISSRTGRW